jgi:lipopolysaccharide/colanic/teichoic acid biosynthesis glycosyltransferase
VSTVDEPQIPEVCVPKREVPDWKRWLDRSGVLLAGTLTFPLLLAVAIFIKIVSHGPVLFTQWRVGHGGEEFLIYKFRTMHVSQESRDDAHREYVAGLTTIDGPTAKPDYQNELILGGKLLRKLSIDELPQLLNVWQGNMSLVGPRPDLLRLDDYEPWQTRRFEVLPGMTGLWQVSGKNRLTFEEMIELDIEYIETQSLWRDLRIMAKTLMVLLWDRNE